MAEHKFGDAHRIFIVYNPIDYHENESDYPVNTFTSHGDYHENDENVSLGQPDSHIQNIQGHPTYEDAVNKANELKGRYPAARIIDEHPERHTLAHENPDEARVQNPKTLKKTLLHQQRKLMHLLKTLT